MFVVISSYISDGGAGGTDLAYFDTLEEAQKNAYGDDEIAIIVNKKGEKNDN